MESFSEALVSAFKTLRDRLGNPLVGAFLIAWCIWNFRVILVLIGEGEGGWEAKISYLDDRLMVPSYMWILHGVVIPLLFSLVWIYVLPKWLRKIVVHHQAQTVATKKALIPLEDLEALSGTAVADLRSRHRLAEQRWESERIELLKAIDLLKTVSSQEVEFDNSKISDSSEEKTIQEVEFENSKNTESLEEKTIDPLEANSDPSKNLKLPVLNSTPDNYSFDKFSQFLERHGDIGSIEEHARRLGLVITNEVLDKSRPWQILFQGRIVKWPWLISDDAASLSGLGREPQREKEFDEETLAVLFYLRNESNGENLQVRHLSNALKIVPFAAQVAVDHLGRIGLISVSSSPIRINAEGRLFLAWLLRNGFSFSLATR